MMLHQFSRNELAIGKEGLELLKNSTVAVLGIGGVGSFAAEALARSGVGRLVLVDKDDVDITNVNRQIIGFTIDGWTTKSGTNEGSNREYQSGL